MRDERIASPRRERAQQTEPDARADEEQLASPVLLLQRQAGNRAVGSLLAREAEKSEADKPASTTIVFPEPIGVLLVDTFRLESRGEISVILPHSSKNPKLFEAAKDGTDLGDVVISSSSGINLKITDAVIASIQLTKESGEVSLRIVGAVEVKEPAKEQEPRDAP